MPSPSLAALLVFVLACVQPSLAQGTRSLAITKVSGSPIEILDASESDPENWARTLEISIRNSGAQSVAVVEIDLLLPELKDEGRVVIATFRYGDPKKDKPKLLEPAKTTKLSLCKESAKQLDKLLYAGANAIDSGGMSMSSGSLGTRRKPAVRLTRGTLRVSMVMFDDKSIWPHKT